MYRKLVSSYFVHILLQKYFAETQVKSTGLTQTKTLLPRSPSSRSKALAELFFPVYCFFCILFFEK